jgi:hypothetical protein
MVFQQGPAPTAEVRQGTKLATLERVINERAQADHILIARLTGTAGRYAR